MIRRDKNPAKTDRIANFMKKIENSPIKRKNIEVLNLTRAVTLENTNKKQIKRPTTNLDNSTEAK